MKKSFLLAWLHIRRKWGSALIAVIAIALSAFCGNLLYKLNLISQSRLQKLDLSYEAVVGAKAGGIEILMNSLGGEGPLPDYVPWKLFQSLKVRQPVHFEDGVNADPQFIETITPIVFFAQTISEKKNRILATDSSFWSHSPKPWHFKEGQAPQLEGEIAVGSQFAIDHNLRLGDTLKSESWLPENVKTKIEINLRVSGILAPTELFWDSIGITDLSTAQKIFAQQPRLAESWGPDVLHYFLIQLKPHGWQSLQTLINQRTVTQAIRVEDETQKLKSLLGTSEEIGWGFEFLILLLAGLSVGVTLAFRFRSLESQVAILRALGTSRFEVRAWLLFEGLLIGGFSILLSTLFEALLFPILWSHLHESLPAFGLQQFVLSESALVWLMTAFMTLGMSGIAIIWLERKPILNSLREI